MGLKIAVTGKGGVGKSTLAAAVALLLSRQGERVLAVDADPDANLASCLGMSRADQERIVPIAAHRALIEERTGAKVRQYGQMFKLNPDVDDIAEKYATRVNGIDLLVLGAVEGGATGCACPESVLLRSLVGDCVLAKKETLVMDMEAGIEHLGRATARGVDTMLVVVEPGQRAVDSYGRIKTMAAQIGIGSVRPVGNKVGGDEDARFLLEQLGGDVPLAMIPFSEALRLSDRDGMSVLDAIGERELACFQRVVEALARVG